MEKKLNLNVNRLSKLYKVHSNGDFLFGIANWIKRNIGCTLAKTFIVFIDDDYYRQILL